VAGEWSQKFAAADPKMNVQSEPSFSLSVPCPATPLDSRVLEPISNSFLSGM